MKGAVGHPPLWDRGLGRGGEEGSVLLGSLRETMEKWGYSCAPPKGLEEQGAIQCGGETLLAGSQAHPCPGSGPGVGHPESSENKRAGTKSTQAAVVLSQKMLREEAGCSPGAEGAAQELVCLLWGLRPSTDTPLKSAVRGGKQGGSVGFIHVTSAFILCVNLRDLSFVEFGYNPEEQFTPSANTKAALLSPPLRVYVGLQQGCWLRRARVQAARASGDPVLSQTAETWEM